MTNLRNFGQATGRLTRDIIAFTNQDGSKRLLITIAAQRNFKNASGERQTDFIEFTAFQRKTQEKSVYDFMKKGDLVTIQYTVRTGSYEKDGNTIYTQNLQVETVDLLQTKRQDDTQQAQDNQPANDNQNDESNDAPFEE